MAVCCMYSHVLCGVYAMRKDVVMSSVEWMRGECIVMSTMVRMRGLCVVPYSVGVDMCNLV